jgi:hypothetical protein
MPETAPGQVRSRELVQQLAEDLRWLEDHARGQSGQDEQVARLRLAAALARNCIGPFLEGAPPRPLHVVVVGGAGAGKSTVANFLTGTPVAETNPQAGFTRHPIAYSTSNGMLPWAQHLGFLGPLERLFEARPSSLDEDVYQVRRIPPPAEGRDLLGQAVVWDCPDMTTWHAGGYVLRLVEVAALADLVVYVASDERYNDEVPTQFLRLILQAGKPVVTCLVKMKEAQAPALVDHFRREVVARIPECPRVAACLAIPQLSPEELADPPRRAARYRQPLVEQVGWWLDRPAETRRATVRGAIEYLADCQESLLAVAKGDLTALRTWRDLVHTGRAEFASRYYREYLSAEKFPRFNEALVRLLELLEVPGVGQYVSKTLWALRYPWRLGKSFLAKAFGTGPEPTIPEEPVLKTALAGWMDHLRKEAARRRDTHPLWRHVEAGFEHGLPENLRAEFDRCLREFQAGLAQEVDTTARSIYEDLEKSPVTLNALRGIKLTVEVASIGGAIAGGILINPWDTLFVFVVAPVIQEMVELLGKQYVDLQKERARARQQELFERCLAKPLAAWLDAWPTTGGSTYERLQQALTRVPQTVADLTELTTARLEGQGS